MATTGTVARHMYTMKKALTTKGFGEDACDETLSKNTGYAVQAHHLISCSVMAAHSKGKLAPLAEAAGYDINEGNNGIALPAYYGHMRKDNLQRHRGGHWDTYYDAVATLLDPIYTDHQGKDTCNDPVAKKSILGDLKAAENTLRSRLTKRQLWLYDWSEQLYNGDYRDEGPTNMKSGRKREGSYASGLQWLANYGSTDVKRRHELKGTKKSLLGTWYTKKYGYPRPGGLT